MPERGANIIGNGKLGAIIATINEISARRHKTALAFAAAAAAPIDTLLTRNGPAPAIYITVRPRMDSSGEWILRMEGVVRPPCRSMGAEGLGARGELPRGLRGSANVRVG